MEHRCRCGRSLGGAAEACGADGACGVHPAQAEPRSRGGEHQLWPAWQFTIDATVTS
jgi:hypothetical protein